MPTRAARAGGSPDGISEFLDSARRPCSNETGDCEFASFSAQVSRTKFTQAGLPPSSLFAEFLLDFSCYSVL